MEDTKKNEMWGKVMAPLAGFLAIVLVAFLIILKLLESGVIGTVMAMILICVIVAAVFGGIFMVIKSILDQIRSVINGKVSENTKVAEKAKKLADREDGIGEMVRSIETSVSSIELVLGGIRKAVDELEGVSGDFQQIFSEMSESMDQTADAVDTITGSATNLMDCMRKAVSMGIPLETAVRAATYNPARAIGAADMCGSITAGHRGDCVLLTKDDLSTKKVIFGGKVVA